MPSAVSSVAVVAVFIFFLSMGLGSFGENYGDRAMEMIGRQ